MLHACFVRSPLPRARIVAIDVHRRAGTARRARGLHRRRPQRRRPRGLVHRHREPGAGHARGRRWPRARCASPAIRSRWSSRRAATWPRTRPSWSRSTTSRCRRSPTTRPPARPTGTRPRGLPGQRRGRAGRRVRPRRSRTPSTGAAHVITETICEQACAAVPMETAGDRRGVVGRQRRADDLGGDPGAARGADVQRAAARPGRAPGPGDRPRHRRRLRAEGDAAARGHVRAAGGQEAARPR